MHCVKHRSYEKAQMRRSVPAVPECDDPGSPGSPGLPVQRRGQGPPDLPRILIDVSVFVGYEEGHKPEQRSSSQPARIRKQRKAAQGRWSSVPTWESTKENIVKTWRFQSRGVRGCYDHNSNILGSEKKSRHLDTSRLTDLGQLNTGRRRASSTCRPRAGSLAFHRSVATMASANLPCSAQVDRSTEPLAFRCPRLPRAIRCGPSRCTIQPGRHTASQPTGWLKIAHWR